MSADNRINQLEQRLREQAGELSHRQGRVSPVAELLAEHVRRDHVRMRARFFCSLVAVLALVGLYGAFRGLQPRSDLTAGRGPTPNESSRRLPSVQQPMKGPATSAAAIVEGERSDAVAGSLPLASGPVPAQAGSIPFLIIHSDGDEQKVIGAGLYVPEHVEELNLPDLSPAEQRAVRTVLGLEEERVSNEAI